jgi:hypothetical protein
MVDTVATIHDMDVSVSEDSITKEASFNCIGRECSLDVSKLTHHSRHSFSLDGGGGYGGYGMGGYGGGGGYGGYGRGGYGGCKSFSWLDVEGLLGSLEVRLKMS